jgi:DNA primase
VGRRKPTKEVPEVAVQRLVEAAGVKLLRQGKAMVGRCPFHDDTGTTLVIEPTANTWTCSTCKASGGPVEWVMRAEGVSRRHALALLAEGLPENGAAGKVKRNSVPKLAAPVTLEADDQALLRQVVEFYHSTLKASPDALAYLESRGIRSAEAVDRFRLGYSNRTLGLRLPAKNRKAGADLRGRLTRLGLYRKTGREHMAGSLVIPIFGAGGEVVQVYGRKTTPGLRPGTPLHLFLPGEPRGVWNLEAFIASKTIIVANSLIDALTFWANGYRNVTAIYGLKGLADDLFTAIREHGTKTVLLAMRRDSEGDRCAEALAETLALRGVSSYRVQFPAGQDANDFARGADDPARALGRALRSAVWLGQGKAPEVEVEAVVEKAPPRKVHPPPEPAVPMLAPERARSTAADAEKAAPEATRTKQEPAGAPQPTETVSDMGVASGAAQDDANPIAVLSTEPASPEPPPPATPEVPTEKSDNEVVIRLGERRYRVRGLARNLSYDTLRVNLLVTLDGDQGDAAPLHADDLNLYSAKQRGAFVKQAAAELGLREVAIKQDLGRVLLKLEELQEEAIRAALEPKRKAVAVSDADRNAALDLLRDPHLVDRILADFQRVGVVGEETNKLVAYLAAVSRKLDDPLAVIIQSSSAAGKTSLMEAVLAFVPEEDRLHFAAMTGQSLFYMGEHDLQHRILAIAEEEGAERASYALKLLQSEGELTIASTGKDPNTGRLVAQEYRVQGPVMLFLTTTAIDLDEELLNRCLVLTVDEDREQTRAIHRLQRERQTLEGLLARRDRDAVLKLQRDAQRLLRPLLVANPFAPDLTFLDDRTRTRRDHTKYLALIRAIALLHQHQREVKAVEHGGQRVEYIEVTLDDIALANRLAHQVLGRSLDDVPPHTRRLLVLLHEVATAACAEKGIDRAAYRFTRKTVREATAWGDTQLKVHLQRLVELEYLLVHGRRGQHVYELVYDGQGQAGERFLTGLLDPEKLRRSGVEAERSGSGRPLVGPESVGGRGAGTAGTGSQVEGMEPAVDFRANTTSQDTTSSTSYPQEGE